MSNNNIQFDKVWKMLHTSYCPRCVETAGVCHWSSIIDISQIPKILLYDSATICSCQLPTFSTILPWAGIYDAMFTLAHGKNGAELQLQWHQRDCEVTWDSLSRILCDLDTTPWSNQFKQLAQTIPRTKPMTGVVSNKGQSSPLSHLVPTANYFPSTGVSVPQVPRGYLYSPV